MKKCFYFCLLMILTFFIWGCGNVTDNTGGNDDNLPPALLLWKYQTEPIYYGSPAIGDDGTIYIGSNGGIEWGQEVSGSVYAINSDGTLKWEYKMTPEENILGAVVIGSNGKLYFVAGVHTLPPSPKPDVAEFNNTTLYCLNADDGTLAWKKEELRTDSNGVKSNVFGYIGSTEEAHLDDDGNLYVPGKHQLWKLNASGQEITRKEFMNEHGHKAGYVSTPVSDENYIYINVDDSVGEFNGIYALDPTSLSVVWRTSCNANELANSSPILDGAGTLYVGRGDDVDGSSCYLYALNTVDGSIKWRFNTEGYRINSTAVIGEDGTVFAATTAKPANSAGVIFAINPDGTKKWKYDTAPDVNGDRDIYNTPCVGNDNTVYFGSEDRYIYALDTSNGNVRRKYDIFDLVPESKGCAAFIHSSIVMGADGTIYVCDFHNIFEVTGYPTANAEFAVDHAELVVHKGGVYALKTSSTGLADSFWPRFRKNNKNTAR